MRLMVLVLLLTTHAVAQISSSKNSSGAGAVDSVFTRTGTVTAQSGDYTAAQITNVPNYTIASTNVQSALNFLDTSKTRYRGDWFDSATQYYPQDIVTYGGIGYICILEHHGATPPNATYWAPVAPATPTGSSLTFTGYDSGGSLSSVPGWSFNSVGNMSVYTPVDITSASSFTANNFELPLEQTSATTLSVTAFGIDFHFDRNHTDTDFNGTLTGANISSRSEGAGFVQNIQGINVNSQLGNGNGGTGNQMRVANFSGYIAAGSSLSDMGALNLYVDSTGSTIRDSTILNIGSNGYVENGFTGINIYNSAMVDGYSNFISVNSTGQQNNANLINLGSNGNVSDSLNMVTGFVNSGTTITNDLRLVPINSSATIGRDFSGFSTYLNAPIGRNFTGFGAYLSSSFGNGTSNFKGVDIQLSSGTNDGSVDGFFFNNNNPTTGTFYNNGLNITNGSAATGYAFNAINVSQQANMTEQLTGFNYYSSGNSRTHTGVNINMTGNVTDDAQGLRVNVNNMTSSSTTQHVMALDIQGGNSTIYGAYTPFNSPVDIGNNFSTTATVQSGSPLTGTDQFLTFIQSNLLADDDIATGPYGLDTNMFGVVSQVAVGSGKTIPLLRSMLLGTSVPLGSGGTITQHTVLTLLGLPSFGGSVSNPTRVGLEDGALLGQAFCDGATTCHFIKVQDGNAQNSFAGGVQLTTSGSQPTCSASYRGTLWNIENGTGVADQLQICQKDSSDNYVWVNIP